VDHGALTRHRIVPAIISADPTSPTAEENASRFLRVTRGNAVPARCRLRLGRSGQPKQSTADSSTCVALRWASGTSRTTSRDRSSKRVGSGRFYTLNSDEPFQGALDALGRSGNTGESRGECVDPGTLNPPLPAATRVADPPAARCAETRCVFLRSARARGGHERVPRFERGIHAARTKVRASRPGNPHVVERCFQTSQARRSWPLFDSAAAMPSFSVSGVNPPSCIAAACARALRSE